MTAGHTVRFTPVSVEEAEALRRDQETRLKRAIADIKVVRPTGSIDLATRYEENLIDGVVDGHLETHRPYFRASKR